MTVWWYRVQHAHSSYSEEFQVELTALARLREDKKATFTSTDSRKLPEMFHLQIIPYICVCI